MKAKSLLIALLAISSIFLLNSCWTGASHNMDDGKQMEWETHEEAVKVNEESENHPMDDGSSMSWTVESMSWTEVDEESIVWEAKAPEASHEMDDGSAMEWETHQE
ncbi:MAG: hypothetical protein ACD_3C00231G0003 [uncultured bacterium (gcode 4)]|uniref:Uncharacterized protein n=1 Tax=uncultured bacterium (gcode 4) TaxID=1234023 RepID=K2GVC3_9BACT|nr:MAG: hypothetical protein ACD_3C00231G0003 [uncultured bacterium (gcode 4)]